jgi:hypothetical protein
VPPEDDFRSQLEERITRFVAQRDHVQGQLIELNQALNSLEKRLEAAVAMYKLEFGVDPPIATETPGSTSRVSRRSRLDGPSWNESVGRALRDAGEPLHINELWRRLVDAGFETEAKDPIRALASVLVRHPDVHRTEPNTYAITGADEKESQQPLEDFDVDGAPHPREGEAA